MRIYGWLKQVDYPGLPLHAAAERGRRLALAALLLASAIAASAQPATAERAEMRPVQVAPRSYFVQGQTALGSSANRNFISNAGFVVTGDSVVVIDALGSPALAEQLLREIRKLTPLPVSHVLVTHYHADHVYGLQTFRAAGARIVAQRRSLEYLGSDTARLRLEASRVDLFPWIDETTQLLAADRWLDGDADLDIGGLKFQLRAVGPAHTPEDMVVNVPSERVLFAGDLVFRERIPFVGQADSRQWIGALDRLQAFEPRVLVPGHGPQSDQAATDIRLTRDYLLHLRQTMGRAARDMEPFDEAYRKADWSRFDKLPLFGPANRMNAYNTYLLMEQERD
jgi:glyoxylase-like metal-dependent hydrolase (beta-lactamase superfamily II)